MLRVLGGAKFCSPRAFSCEIVGSCVVSEIEIYLNDLSNPSCKNNPKQAVLVVTEKPNWVNTFNSNCLNFQTQPKNQTAADPEVFNMKVILNFEEKIKCQS